MSDYQFTKSSLRRFRKLPQNVQARVIEKLDYFCSQENPLIFAEPLTQNRIGEYRFRIGDYRVAFDVEGEIIIIHDVDHRKDIYR